MAGVGFSADEVRGAWHAPERWDSLQRQEPAGVRKERKQGPRGWIR